MAEGCEVSDDLEISGRLVMEPGARIGRRVVVNGSLTATSAAVTLDATGYQSNTQVIVNGTLSATSSTFSHTGSYFTALTIKNAGDLSDNAFDLTLYVPAAVIWECSLLARAVRINFRRSVRAFFDDLFSNPAYQPLDLG